MSFTTQGYSRTQAGLLTSAFLAPFSATHLAGPLTVGRAAALLFAVLLATDLLRNRPQRFHPDLATTMLVVGYVGLCGWAFLSAKTVGCNCEGKAGGLFEFTVIGLLAIVAIGFEPRLRGSALLAALAGLDAGGGAGARRRRRDQLGHGRLDPDGRSPFGELRQRERAGSGGGAGNSRGAGLPLDSRAATRSSAARSPSWSLPSSSLTHGAESSPPASASSRLRSGKHAPRGGVRSPSLSAPCSSPRPARASTQSSSSTARAPASSPCRRRSSPWVSATSAVGTRGHWGRSRPGPRGSATARMELRCAATSPPRA